MFWFVKSRSREYIVSHKLGFALSFCSDVVTSYPFTALLWVNKDKSYSLRNFPAHRIIYFLQLLKTNLLSETIYSQIQPAFIYSNSAIIVVE